MKLMTGPLMPSLLDIIFSPEEDLFVHEMEML